MARYEEARTVNQLIFHLCKWPGARHAILAGAAGLIIACFPGISWAQTQDAWGQAQDQTYNGGSFGVGGVLVRPSDQADDGTGATAPSPQGRRVQQRPANAAGAPQAQQRPAQQTRQRAARPEEGRSRAGQARTSGRAGDAQAARRGDSPAQAASTQEPRGSAPATPPDQATGAQSAQPADANASAQPDKKEASAGGEPAASAGIPPADTPAQPEKKEAAAASEPAVPADVQPADTPAQPEKKEASGASDPAAVAALPLSDKPAEPEKAAPKPDAPASTPVEPAVTASTQPADAPAKPDAAPDQGAPATAAADAQTVAAASGPAGDGGALDRMIGQMLVVGFRGLTPDDPGTQALAAQIKSGTVGGIVFMDGNIKSPEQTAALTAFFRRQNAAEPLFIAVDKEAILTHDKGFKEFPSAAQTGQSIDPLDAYTVYKSMAAELSANGFNINFGPVLDLQRDGEENQRCFGSQPKAVVAFAKAFAVAHHDAGVLSVPKHFPGSGADSLTDDALEPYRQLIASGNASAIMTGHAAGPAVSDEDGLPASLSQKTVTKLLRGDLGFKGVAVSANLETMDKRLSLEESAVRAIKAGNDLLLIGNQAQGAPDLPEKVATAIKKAVESGTLSREAVQTSYDRIMALKQRLGAATRAVASAKQDGAAQTAQPAQ